jgi:hypothetical protein
MEVKTIVVTLVYKFKKISGCYWHTICEKFDGDISLASLHEYVCHIASLLSEVFEDVAQ